MIDLLHAPARQASSLREIQHRPWPLPKTSWVMAQTVDDLLFAHWRADANSVRALVPDGLDVQTHNGSAWIGITPYVVTGLRARGTLPLPLVSSFCELNVRTYVTLDDRPGIWFFSLDASSRLAVEAARRLYRLPAFHARIAVDRRAGRILYESVRHEGRAFSASFAASGPAAGAEPESLEHFLTERYCLYAEDDTGLYRGEIHHRPWPLQPAEAAIELNTLAPDGVRLEGEPLLHFSARQDVVLWPLGAVSDGVT